MTKGEIKSALDLTNSNITLITSQTKLRRKYKVYALYRVYSGSKYFVGYYRDTDDYTAEINYLNSHESGPETYVVKEMPSEGIPLGQIKDGLAERKRANKLTREEQHRAAKRNKDYQRWLAGERKERLEWQREHPDISYEVKPLCRRRFPVMFGVLPVGMCHVNTDLKDVLRYLYD